MRAKVRAKLGRRRHKLRCGGGGAKVKTVSVRVTAVVSNGSKSEGCEGKAAAGQGCGGCGQKGKFVGVGVTAAVSREGRERNWRLWSKVKAEGRFS